jgi:acyl-coenzyme A thioesterase PaaI-like protein
MKVSAKVLKWVLRFYPPLFFQRIWIQRFDKNFKSVEVKIFKSILNTNYNNSIFGGTIFAASDPFYAILFDQILAIRGFKTRVWLKSASIQYLKPGHSNLYFKIEISEIDIEEAIHVLNTIGKFVKAFPLEIYNKKGELCAIVNNEIYIRNLYKGEENIVAY